MGRPAMVKGTAAVRKLIVLKKKSSKAKCTNAATKEINVAPERVKNEDLLIGRNRKWLCFRY